MPFEESLKSFRFTNTPLLIQMVTAIRTGFPSFATGTSPDETLASTEGIPSTWMGRIRL